MMLTLIYHVKHLHPFSAMVLLPLGGMHGDVSMHVYSLLGGSLTLTGAMGGLKTDFGQR